MPREKSAGAVIFRKEGDIIYYLLLHYEAGHWDFPKGHIEGRETEEETVRREVFEETGIKDIDIKNGFKEFVKYFFRKTYNLPKQEKSRAPWVFKVVDFYLAETRAREVKISHEHIGFQWLPYEEALRQLNFKNSKNILKKAHEFLLSLTNR